MFEFTVREIADATKGIIAEGGREAASIKNIVTDSRKIDCFDPAVTAFVGIKGEKFDGNAFAGEAADKGVALIITDSEAAETKLLTGPGGENTSVLRVEDSLRAYGAIAALYRDTLKINVCGVTGSVGKTTTKEMISRVLESRYKNGRTRANFNNEIGVPATILELDESFRTAVIEMGMRGFGQIDYLAKIAKPDAAVITNIGCAHLEIMGSKENTMRAKFEIAAGMRWNNLLVLNGDDEYLSDRKKVHEILRDYNANPTIVTYGFGEGCDVRAENIRLERDFSEFTVDGVPFRINIPGEHIIMAVLAAVTVGNFYRIENEAAAEALKNVNAASIGRQQIKKTEKFTLIDDCYNAGPESVKSSLRLLGQEKNGRRVAFLGDMLELGERAAMLHGEVGRAASENRVDLLVCVGELAKNIGRAAAGCEKIIYCENSEKAAGLCGELLRDGDSVLVKGSHAMNMGIISDKILNL